MEAIKEVGCMVGVGSSKRRGKEKKNKVQFVRDRILLRRTLSSMPEEHVRTLNRTEDVL